MTDKKMMMKNYLKLLTIVLLAITISCGDDDNSTSRSSESIEVILDNGTPEYFSNNIIAKDNPLPASTGFSCIFNFSAENAIGNTFKINFGGIIDPCPFTQPIPFSKTISGSISSFIEIPGVTFDDTAANNLTVNITNFGNNTGDDIDMTITGTYYQISDTNQHTINVTIHKTVARLF